MNRFANAHVRAASTDVAGHRFANLIVRDATVVLDYRATNRHVRALDSLDSGEGGEYRANTMHARHAVDEDGGRHGR